MAKVLNCSEMDLECDHICAASEEELLRLAEEYVEYDQSYFESPSEFWHSMRLLLKDTDDC